MGLSAEGFNEGLIAGGLMRVRVQEFNEGLSAGGLMSGLSAGGLSARV